MSDDRRLVGRVGERLAAAVLTRHGITVLARNVAVAGGEVDIVGLENGQPLVVEVRTVTGLADPLEAFDALKRAQVGRLARIIGAHRVDLVAVHLDADAAEIRWVKGAA